MKNLQKFKKYWKYLVSLIIIVSLNYYSYHINGRLLWLTTNLMLMLLSYIFISFKKQNL